ncbi:flippase-like domain-containing protein [Cellulomonas sp. C5510]|nr:flippase-like domain-containing protein [Cellulomonas sp. C5510]
MSRVLGALRSPWVRGGFLVVAVAAAVWAVQREWDDIGPALRDMPVGLLLAALLTGVVYLLLTLLSWRAVLADLGSPLPLRKAFAVFFPSQLGKYVPGGVWNVVAVSELGADLRIPRRRSFSAMAVALLVSVVTGLAVAAPALTLTSGGAGAGYAWVWLALPLAVALLAPPVSNRLLGVAMRLLRREPLEHPLTARGTVAAAGWSVAAWLCAGLQLWLIGLGVGFPADADAYARVSGAYALAWVVGFVVVVVPAGLGAREVVLVALLAGVAPDAGAVIVVVLLARVAQTLADFLLAGAGVLVLRRGAARAAQAQRSDAAG